MCTFEPESERFTPGSPATTTILGLQNAWPAGPCRDPGAVQPALNAAWSTVRMQARCHCSDTSGVHTQCGSGFPSSLILSKQRATTSEIDLMPGIRIGMNTIARENDLTG